MDKTAQTQAKATSHSATPWGNKANKSRRVDNRADNRGRKAAKTNKVLGSTR